MNRNRMVMAGMCCMSIALLLDQLSKWYLLEIVGIGHIPPIELTSFFNLVMVWNHGISFGMFAEHNQPLILIAMALVITVILGFWLVRAESLRVALAIGTVMGGAIGNVIDRVRFGAVADFFDFHVMGYHWPAFNIADSCIFIGVVVLCIDGMLDTKKSNLSKDKDYD
jgi:signal peptidase II